MRKLLKKTTIFLLTTAIFFSVAKPSLAAVTFDCSTNPTPGSEFTYSDPPDSVNFIYEITPQNADWKNLASQFTVKFCIPNDIRGYCSESPAIPDTNGRNTLKASFLPSTILDNTFNMVLTGIPTGETNPVNLCQIDNALITNPLNAAVLEPDCSSFAAFPSVLASNSKTVTATFNPSGLRDDHSYAIFIANDKLQQMSPLFSKNTAGLFSFILPNIDPTKGANVTLIRSGPATAFCPLTLKYDPTAPVEDNTPVGPDGVVNINFNTVNPLQLGGSPNVLTCQGAACASKVAGDLTNPDGSINPGKVISRFISYAIPIAGIILFVMIMWGGFEMVLGSSDSKAQDAGKQRITAAVIGFIVLFAAYWIAQLIQAVFGVRFLG